MSQAYSQASAEALFNSDPMHTYNSQTTADAMIHICRQCSRLTETIFGTMPGMASRASNCCKAAR